MLFKNSKTTKYKKTQTKNCWCYLSGTNDLDHLKTSGVLNVIQGDKISIIYTRSVAICDLRFGCKNIARVELFLT